MLWAARHCAWVARDTLFVEETKRTLRAATRLFRSVAVFWPKLEDIRDPAELWKRTGPAPFSLSWCDAPSWVCVADLLGAARPGQSLRAPHLLPSAVMSQKHSQFVARCGARNGLRFGTMCSRTGVLGEGQDERSCRRKSLSCAARNRLRWPKVSWSLPASAEPTPCCVRWRVK